ncbi:MAG: ketoacyl-ACP synthase III [Bacillota bacterium]|nr:ketoacyl-ACP synthase III [Bacillota bacterium]
MGMLVAGIGHYLPKREVSNDELLRMVSENSPNNLDIEGLKKKLNLNIAISRHFASEEESGLYMAEQAIRNCLERSDIDVLDIDLIIYTAMYRRYIEPAMAICLSEIIGAKNANGFDLSNACMGFLNAIELARLYIESKRYKTILVVGAEENSKQIPLDSFGDIDKNPGFSSLTIADGAAAAILTCGEADRNFGLYRMKTFSEHKDVCKVPLGKGKDDMKLDVNSRKLAAVALNIMSDFIPEFVYAAEDYLQGVDIMFIHQVTGYQKRFCGKLRDDLFNKFYTTFPHVGNTGSVSIPLAMSLAQQEGKLKRGDKVVLIVGASGFSCGGTAFVY